MKLSPVEQGILIMILESDVIQDELEDEIFDACSEAGDDDGSLLREYHAAQKSLNDKLQEMTL